MREHSSVSSSITVEINSLVQKKIELGFKIFNFSAGEPKLPTCESIVKAVCHALKKEKVLYPPVSGLPQLKKLAIEWMNKNYRCHYQEENALVVSGGKLGIYLLLQYLLQEGDEVIIPAPYWVSYPAMVKLFKGVPVPIETNESQAWKITAEMLKEACTGKSKILILNNGSNPTGVLYTREELSSILKVAKEKNLFVISDEVYSELVYDKHSYISCGEFDEYLENMAVIQSCSKNFAMTGWRIGFIFGNKNVIKQITSLVSQSTSGVSLVSQWAAIAALKKSKKINAIVRKQMKKNRDSLIEAFKKYLKLKVNPPPSSLYLFISLDDLGIKNKSSGEFCKKALEQANVALVPGVAFGKEGYVRFSFGAERQELKAGVKALSKSLD